jgi:ubiquinone/menaquinone biosynthesis C-methylase UbiE
MAKRFDQWYADMAESPRSDEMAQRHLGLPAELLSTSLLPWDGITEVAEALALNQGQLLVDLACGRGGYGLELAARTGARLLGIDFSAEAVRQARDSAVRWNVEADFKVGDLTATGLADKSADAIVVVDAIQFPSDPTAAYTELARVIRPSGHVVVTSWEPVNPEDEALSEQSRRVNVQQGLAAAGFIDISVRERPDWAEAEHSMWLEAAAMEPGDDPALTALYREGVRVLETFDKLRRIMATAVRPGG